jgi:hypothetical protein
MQETSSENTQYDLQKSETLGSFKLLEYIYIGGEKEIIKDNEIAQVHCRTLFIQHNISHYLVVSPEWRI